MKGYDRVETNHEADSKLTRSRGEERNRKRCIAFLSKRIASNEIFARMIYNDVSLYVKKKKKKRGEIARRFSSSYLVFNTCFEGIRYWSTVRRTKIAGAEYKEVGRGRGEGRRSLR